MTFIFENLFIYLGTLFCLIILAVISVTLIYLDHKKNSRPKKKKKIIENVNIEPARNEEEKLYARLELEKMMAQMEEDLIKKTEMPVLAFEQEQEEQSIISYQELVNNTKKADQKIDNVNLKEITFPKKEQEIKNDLVEDLIESKTTLFRNTDFISPVYGKVDNNVSYPKIDDFSETRKLKKELDHIETELEKTLNIGPISEEIMKNAEFLKTLKEFRKNL